MFSNIFMHTQCCVYGMVCDRTIKNTIWQSKRICYYNRPNYRVRVVSHMSMRTLLCSSTFYGYAYAHAMCARIPLNKHIIVVEYLFWMKRRTNDWKREKKPNSVVIEKSKTEFRLNFYQKMKKKMFFYSPCFIFFLCCFFLSQTSSFCSCVWKRQSKHSKWWWEKIKNEFPERKHHTKGSTHKANKIRVNFITFSNIKVKKFIMCL